MDIVRNAVRNVFPAVDAGKLADATELGSLPDWDSMNAINLQLELESLAGRSDMGLQLTPRMTLGELAHLLAQLGVK